MVCDRIRAVDEYAGMFITGARYQRELLSLQIARPTHISGDCCIPEDTLR